MATEETIEAAPIDDDGKRALSDVGEMLLVELGLGVVDVADVAEVVDDC
jgi:hypothetical protein